MVTEKKCVMFVAGQYSYEYLFFKFEKLEPASLTIIPIVNTVTVSSCCIHIIIFIIRSDGWTCSMNKSAINCFWDI